jgi:hypothetical protein
VSQHQFIAAGRTLWSYSACSRAHSSCARAQSPSAASARSSSRCVSVEACCAAACAAAAASRTSSALRCFSASSCSYTGHGHSCTGGPHAHGARHQCSMGTLPHPPLRFGRPEQQRAASLHGHATAVPQSSRHMHKRADALRGRVGGSAAVAAFLRVRRAQMHERTWSPAACSRARCRSAAVRPSAS